MRFRALLAALGIAWCGCGPPGPTAPTPAPADPDPERVLDEARELAGQGRFEEALQKHIWFHEHALEYDPNLSAVRLSFALGYWAELGEQYPKAREALVAIRDRDDRRLRDGPRTFARFHDVVAINEYLKERPKTVELFRTLHATAPEFAAECYHVAERDLAALGEYKLCAGYIPDPAARVRRMRETRESSLKLAGEHGPEFRDHAERAFAEETCRVIAILVGAGRRPDAEQVRDRALAVRGDAPFRQSVDRALRGKWQPDR